MSQRSFVHRVDAGRRLGRVLAAVHVKRPLVLGIPRGGIVVAAEVARSLHAPLDIVLTKKIGAIQNPEFAIGAVTESGALLYEPDTLAQVGASWEYVQSERERLTRDLSARGEMLRRGRPPLDLAHHTVIVVDDGLATGWTMKGAILDARAHIPLAVIAAIPVACSSALAEIEAEADRVVCLTVPPDFSAVGEWYETFDEVSDEAVMERLDEARALSPIPLN